MDTSYKTVVISAKRVPFSSKLEKGGITAAGPSPNFTGFPINLLRAPEQIYSSN
jgi:hypothetical protein